MPDAPRPEALHEAYLTAQENLWARWMEAIQHLETLSSPEFAWWSFPYRAVEDITPAARPGIPPPEHWLALWRDGVVHKQGALAAMTEWNRRVRETQARINREFLEAWMQAVTGPDAPVPGDEIDGPELAALKAAAARALGLSPERAVRSLPRPQRRQERENASGRTGNSPPPTAA